MNEVNMNISKIETTEISENSKRIIVDLKKMNRPELESLITEAEQGHFDDYHKNSYAFPRMELVDRLKVLGLHDMAKKIIHGGYDD
jgi:hypothetical protein